MIRFLTLLAVATMVIYGFLWWGTEYHWIPQTPSWQNRIMVFLLLITSIIFFFLNSHSKIDPQQFVIYYIGSIAAKIFVACVFVIIMLWLDRAGAVPNMILFIVTYLLFTFVEVLLLFRKLNQGRPEHGN